MKRNRRPPHFQEVRHFYLPWNNGFRSSTSREWRLTPSRIALHGFSESVHEGRLRNHFQQLVTQNRQSKSPWFHLRINCLFLFDTKVSSCLILWHESLTRPWCLERVALRSSKVSQFPKPAKGILSWHNVGKKINNARGSKTDL